MRLLLDHNIPSQLKRLLKGHITSAAREMKWDQLRNGDLLAVAEASGFAPHAYGGSKHLLQQDNRLRKLALVVLSTNHRPTLVRNLEPILQPLARSHVGSFEFLPIPKSKT